MVQETAQKHDVDPALVSAVISTESNWNTSALSRKGAQGLMQLVPETAQNLGVFNAWDPQQNIDGGVRYLHMLLDRYNGDLPKALAAYNAGPSAVDRWGGVPNFPETQEYVRKVTHTYFQPGSATSIRFARRLPNRSIGSRRMTAEWSSRTNETGQGRSAHF